MPDWRPDSEVWIRSVCLVASTCVLELDRRPGRRAPRRSVTSTAAASGSCSAWLSRSAATYAGSAVSSARIRISVGPASESMPTRPLSSRLAVTVQIEPGPVTRSTRAHGPDAVGEHRDRLRAADGVDLVDAEQRARRQDRRVRQAAVVLLRRGRQRDRADAGDLGGHDVHQHAGDQRRDAAGHVEPDPVDRHLAVGDPGARRRARWPRPARARPRRWPAAGGSTPPARPGCRGRGAASASLQRLGRHPDVGLGRRRRTAADSSRIASSPRVRTASQIACTAGTAASTSKSARGTTSR